jgi:hypothetical protein
MFVSLAVTSFAESKRPLILNIFAFMTWAVLGHRY